MENVETINEITTNLEASRIEFKRIDVNKFVILFIITFGLYGIWWIYKSWQFFKDKEKTDIMPAIRALFSIFFLIPLFNKISRFAKVNGYNQAYSSVLLFFGFWIFNLLGNLPEPYFLIALFSIICLIPPFKALNFAVDYCDDFKVINQENFNGRQIFLLIAGSIFWILVLIGLFIGE
ncbi:MAG: hypothetical protein ACWA6U_18090 [Breznakibacter sp.]